MALSESLVEVVFATMLTRYGSAWLAKWHAVPLNAVKADWAEQLDGFGVIAINHGLLHLPEDFPPTAVQFKRACLGRPDPMPLAIEGPKPDPVRVEHLIARARASQVKRGPLQWAYDLQDREKHGESLTPAQRADWREALAAPMASGNLCFSDIDPASLPPGMRRDMGLA